MAVRFDASTEQYTSIVSLGSQASYSICSWVKLSVDRNDYSTFWSFDQNSSGTATILQTNSDGTSLMLWDDPSGSNLANGPNMAVGVWYFVAVAVSGTSGTMYWRTAAQTAFSTATWTGAARTITRLWLGNNVYTEWVNGCEAAIKFWTEVGLTQADFAREASQYAPGRVANLQAYYPLQRPDALDYSGNGRTLSGGAGVTYEDGPPIPLQRIVVRPWLLSAPTGGGPIVLGQASETDTATSLTRSKIKAIGQSTETDTATSPARTKLRAVGLASEADTSTALLRSKRQSVAQALETDTATAVTRSKVRALNLASEATTAFAVTRSKRRVLDQSTETDQSQPLTMDGFTTVILGQAVETSAAQPLARSKARTVGQVLESDAATALVRSKRLGISQGIEADTAHALSTTSVVVLGQAISTETVTPLVRSKRLALGTAGEADTALALSMGDDLPGQRYTVGYLTTRWSTGRLEARWRTGRLEA